MVQRLTIRIDTMTHDAGECPMCGFDSLRRVVGYHLSPHGVSTVWDQTYCGRCIADLKEAL